eukprot:503192-Rhodomonas_salina.1
MTERVTDVGNSNLEDGKHHGAVEAVAVAAYAPHFRESASIYGVLSAVVSVLLVLGKGDGA